MVNQKPRISLYVHLFIGTIVTFTLLYFFFLDITRPNVDVPAWMVTALLAILSGLLGVDILSQYRGDE